MASAVTRLHNFCQTLRLSVPAYEFEANGPPNAVVHMAKVFINGLQYGAATRSAKAAAKEAAAADGLAEMHRHYPGYTF